MTEQRTRPTARPDAHGSRTMTVERAGTSQVDGGAQDVGRLHLRAVGREREREALSDSTHSDRRVVWTEDTIDNEGMGKKKSKSTSCAALTQSAVSITSRVRLTSPPPRAPTRTRTGARRVHLSHPRTTTVQRGPRAVCGIGIRIAASMGGHQMPLGPKPMPMSARRRPCTIVSILFLCCVTTSRTAARMACLPLLACPRRASRPCNNPLACLAKRMRVCALHAG